MKIVFIINELSGGGAERVVLTLLDGFSAKGFETSLITLFSTCDYYAPENIPTHCLSKKSRKGILNKILMLGVLVYRLRKQLKNTVDDQKQHLIVSHLPFANIVTILAGISSAYYCIHNTWSKSISGGMVNNLKKKLFRILYRNKKLIAVSKGVESDLVDTLNIKPQSIQTIYNPFDFKKIQEQAAEKICEIPQQPYLIHVGSFTAQKRHDLLLQAYHQLKHDFPLYLLGKGPLITQIQNQIKKLKLQEKVHLVGWQKNVFPWIANAQLLILCSDYEGLPTVLIESLICNTLVVSTNCPSGTCEILKGPLAQCLTETGNWQKLSQKIDELLDNPISISEKMLQPYSLDTSMNQYLKLVEKQR